MLIVGLQQVIPGMRLAVSVPHPNQPEQPLLRAGFELTHDITGRLGELGVRSVLIDHPGFEALDRHLGPLLSPARAALQTSLRRTVTCAGDSKHGTLRTEEYYDATRELIESLQHQGRNVVFVDQMSRGSADAVEHGLSVAHLSLLLGIRLENYIVNQRSRLPCNRAKDVLSLGVAGMLHDIGKAQLPAEARGFNAVTPPTDEHRETWQAHVRLGYDMVRDTLEPAAAAAILHHHQHFDGSGFPSLASTGAPQSGERIHVFARILRVADLFDRLANPPGNRRLNVEVLHLMRTRFAAQLDPVVLHALHEVAPAFPPGSTVELSDGSRAVVVDIDPDDLFRPAVRRLRDDWTPEEQTLWLSETPELRIVSTGGVPVDCWLPDRTLTRAA